MAKDNFVFKRGFKAKAEKMSIELREDMKLHPCAPLSAKRLAEHLNVSVYGVSDIVEDIKDIEIISGRHAANYEFSGVHLINIDGDDIILHNEFHSKGRQESNIMHELAHVICKHGTPKEYLTISIAQGMRYYNEEQEEEAKYLGGCLQISRAGLLWAMKQNLSHQQISDYYTATLDMVKYRMNITGVEKQAYFFKRKKTI